MLVMKIKKQKARKKCFMKKKQCLEATQLESKINCLEKNETDVDSLKTDHKKFIKIKK